jgi:p-cumate 2,3-dioxygenase beta subunit
VRDDWFLLSQRVAALLDGTAWAESPPSTTHRMISNVRVVDRGDDEFEVTANLLVHRSSAGRLDAYPAFLALVLLRSADGGFLIRERRAVLAMEELRPHGRLSIIL